MGTMARLPPLPKICGWLCKAAVPQMNAKRELSPDLPPGDLVYLKSFALELEGNLQTLHCLWA